MSILLEHLRKSYGAEDVLHDVSDVIPDGSLTALLGPSGSGKSTLLKMIAGLESVDAGRVVLHGRDVTRLPARERNIGFCFQDYAPFYQLSVFDNIAYGLKVRKMSNSAIRAEVSQLLELLLDEPFAALDAQVGGEMRQWVRSLQRELGITTLLVTHNQAEAMEVADRVVILQQGRIEQVGAPSEVYDAPANEFVKSFLGPTSPFGTASIRPHDLVIEVSGIGESGVVTDLIRLGFEVRVVVTLDTTQKVWVQLTHHEAADRNIRVGERVGVRQRMRESVSLG